MSLGGAFDLFVVRLFLKKIKTTAPITVPMIINKAGTTKPTVQMKKRIHFIVFISVSKMNV